MIGNPLIFMLISSNGTGCLWVGAKPLHPSGGFGGDNEPGPREVRTKVEIVWGILRGDECGASARGHRILTAAARADG